MSNILTYEGLRVLGKENMKLTKMKKFYAEVSVRAVLVALAERYGAGDKLFFWRDRTWTPYQALSQWEDYLLNIKSGTFGVIRFYGGPPKKCTWYNGTILTMLLDMMLFCTTTENWALKDKLENRGLVVPPF